MIMLLLELLPLKSYDAVLLNLLRVEQGSFNKFALLHHLFLNKMGNIYNDIAEAVKTIYKDDVKVDNFVFKLHRSFTSLLCIVFATILLVTEVSTTRTFVLIFYKILRRFIFLHFLHLTLILFIYLNHTNI